MAQKPPSTRIFKVIKKYKKTSSYTIHDYTLELLVNYL